MSKKEQNFYFRHRNLYCWRDNRGKSTNTPAIRVNATSVKNENKDLSPIEYSNYIQRCYLLLNDKKITKKQGTILVIFLLITASSKKTVLEPNILESNPKLLLILCI